MDKQININVNSISKAKDKKYVFDIYDKMIDCILSNSKIISGLEFISTKTDFNIQFKCKVCIDGDFLWVMLKEYLSCIAETEPNIEIIIDDIEQTGEGVTYKMYKYRCN